MTILGLLVALILICLVIWAAKAILTAFGIGEPLHTVIWVVVVILAVLIVLGYVGAPLPHIPMR